MWIVKPPVSPGIHGISPREIDQNQVPWDFPRCGPNVGLRFFRHSNVIHHELQTWQVFDNVDRRMPIDKDEVRVRLILSSPKFGLRENLQESMVF